MVRPRPSIALAALLLASACAGSPSDLEVAEVPLTTTTPTTTTPPTMVGAPTVGECRGPVTQAEIDPAADARPPVPCVEPHGFETVHVGELIGGPDAWPAEDLPADLTEQIAAACQPALDAYLSLPAPGPYVVPNRISDFAYFLPTADQWASGARWFRCDAFVTPLTAGEQTSISGTLAGIGAAALPAAYRICDDANGFVSCTDPHDLEYVAAVEAGQDTYPTVSDPALAERCRGPVAQELAITGRDDLSFSVAIPTEQAWQAGLRVIYCVVGAAGGEPLVGTLAGIGDSAPLPIAAGAGG
jgi:Septum formation